MISSTFDQGQPESFAILGVFVYLWLHFNEPKTALRGLAVVTAPLCLASLCRIYLSPSLDHLIVNSALKSCTAYLAALIISVTLYRISPFHPLYHIPGPLAFKLTKLTGIWATHSGQQHLVFKRLHDHYGKIVRTGPNEVSVIDASAINSIYGANGMPKGKYYSARQDSHGPGYILILNGEQHDIRRRLWNRGMNAESLREYADIMENRAFQLVDKLTKKAETDGRVDLSEWITYFVFDFLGDVAFGGGFELLRDEGDNHGIRKAMDDYSILASLFCHVPWLAHSLNLLPIPSLNHMRQFGLANAMRRMKATTSRKDLWYHLIDEADIEKKKPTIREVITDSTFAIVAGVDSTASALSALFFCLVTNPWCYKTLRAEVDSVFPLNSNPLDTKRHTAEEMPWLNACIKEALRLLPPVLSNGPREVPSDSNGRIIANCFIPPGTQVYVPPYSLHRDENYFSPSPDKFIPERWMKDSTEEYHTRAEAFIPFSVGSRNCVGKNLAMQEMLSIVSLLIQRFDFSLPPGSENLKETWPLQLHDHLVTMRGPLIVKIRNRVVT